MKKYASIAEYMTNLPEMQKTVAQIMRDLLADAAPKAREKISYNMPAIEQNGKVVVYFDAGKDHLGFYPTADPIVAFADQLKEYKTSKGTIQLAYDQPLPAKLICEIVAFRVDQVTKG
ncbi:DUF1801 domain-containing protein [Pediococcus inopinatus]|uniref:iron chaperone n=1 Tax=Pediococcus TaxID=1253 RepID=UPI002B25AA60|nr:DUF1801 domain-containing protein [Pediococcus inopinatus]WPC16681.1 DUF1801 domain-containing protein [Pediococcus inopinatus]